MFAIDRFYTFLKDNESITARKARFVCKVENVADLVYRLRNEGVSVYTNRVRNARGESVCEYRLGKASKAFLTAKSEKTARKALYKHAIAA